MKFVPSITVKVKSCEDVAYKLTKILILKTIFEKKCYAKSGEPRYHAGHIPTKRLQPCLASSRRAPV